MSYRPWLEERALRQVGGLPPEALDVLVRALARICEDPYNRLFSRAVRNDDPRERMAELGNLGFMEFRVDEAAGLVRVLTLVWAGLMAEISSTLGVPIMPTDDGLATISWYYGSRIAGRPADEVITQHRPPAQEHRRPFVLVVQDRASRHQASRARYVRWRTPGAGPASSPGPACTWPHAPAAARPRRSIRRRRPRRRHRAAIRPGRARRARAQRAPAARPTLPTCSAGPPGPPRRRVLPSWSSAW